MIIPTERSPLSIVPRNCVALCIEYGIPMIKRFCFIADDDFSSYTIRTLQKSARINKHFKSQSFALVYIYERYITDDSRCVSAQDLFNHAVIRLAVIYFSRCLLVRSSAPYPLLFLLIRIHNCCITSSLPRRGYIGS